MYLSGLTPEIMSQLEGVASDYGWVEDITYKGIQLHAGNIFRDSEPYIHIRKKGGKEFPHVTIRIETGNARYFIRWGREIINVEPIADPTREEEELYAFLYPRFDYLACAKLLHKVERLGSKVVEMAAAWGARAEKRHMLHYSPEKTSKMGLRKMTSDKKEAAEGLEF